MTIEQAKQIERYFVPVINKFIKEGDYDDFLRELQTLENNEEIRLEIDKNGRIRYIHSINASKMEIMTIMVKYTKRAYFSHEATIFPLSPCQLLIHTMAFRLNIPVNTVVHCIRRILTEEKCKGDLNLSSKQQIFQLQSIDYKRFTFLFCPQLTRISENLWSPPTTPEIQQLYSNSLNFSQSNKSYSIQQNQTIHQNEINECTEPINTVTRRPPMVRATSSISAKAVTSIRSSLCPISGRRKQKWHGSTTAAKGT